ncbi:MAG: hypothetical protein P8012_10720 [Desulfobacterales bacterium]
MLTIEQRRKTDRKRRERWRKKKLAQGYRQIQLMLAPEAQAILMNEKYRTNEPYVQIIHRAILELDKGIPIASSENQAKPVISKTNETQNSDSRKTRPPSKSPDTKKASQEGQLKLF